MAKSVRADRENMSYDVIIVGAGPAGLSCAIRLKQLAAEKGGDLSVCVVEKGSEVGAHLMSGAVFEPRALNELIPDWKDKGAPLDTPAGDDRFLFMTRDKAYRFMTPPQMHNKGNYIISLGALGKWLAAQAEGLGVEIYPGFAAAEVLYGQDGAVIGIATGDMGVHKDGSKGPMFTPGVELHARLTIFAEGCRGSLSRIVMDKFDLREGADPQTYGIGVKEIWEIKPEHHKKGQCTHTLGWPLDRATYGGSWIYHMDNNLVSIGFVVGLDYQNPYLSPFEEMQRFKTHPAIRPLLEGGRRVAYGARALVEGGLQSLPKLDMPGAILIGDAAGFLNVPKIKGTHTAMKSGMVAAETAYAAFTALGEAGFAGPEAGGRPDMAAYRANLEKTWLWCELYRARNIRPGFHRGLWFGLLNAAFQTFGGWFLPFTLKNHADHKQLKKAADCEKIDYPKPDGVITFDRLSSVFLTGTNHEEDQPSHLKLIDPSIPIGKNLPLYAEPAQRYCPAAVYEVVEEAGQPVFRINAQNCIHCKTCDIKDPEQNIVWTVPQGGEGPNYAGM